MKTHTLFLKSAVLAIACILSICSCRKPQVETPQETNKTSFITVWDLTKGKTVNDSISFTVKKTGTVDYSWEEIGGGNQSGSGRITKDAFTLKGVPLGARIRLKLSPDSLSSVQIHSDMLLDISQWGGTRWSSMEYAFSRCSNLNSSATDLPNLSLVSSMEYMFEYDTTLNGPLNIDNWNVENVSDLHAMFMGAYHFNQPIGDWNTQNVNDMQLMFSGAMNFNQPIGNWNTSNVWYMSSMFSGAMNFNQPIGNWNTEKVSNMRQMFSATKKFNQPISSWNVSRVENMFGMFNRAQAFNQPIGNWDISKATDISYMFSGAESFNQPIDNWDTKEVTSIKYILNKASAFNQSLAGWNLERLHSNEAEKALSNCGMDDINYSNTLKGWADQASCPENIKIGVDSLKYNDQGETARNYLTQTKHWEFIGDSKK